MKRIPQELRAASYELRAINRRFSSWLEARGSKLAARLMVCAFFAVAGGRLLAEEPETTIKVDVKLVNVFVTVTDARGAPVANLTKENFLLKEDGKEQKIAIFDKESALPLSIALAVDTSLSTRKDLPLELTSARKFAHTIVRPQDGLAVYKFSETVSLMVPFTSDLKKIDAGIERERNGAATALYDAVYLGSQALTRREGRKVMVVITDGGDTMSQVNYKEALRAAQEAEAIIYSIIIVPIEADAGRDTGGEHALIQISSDTGGKYYYAGSSAHNHDMGYTDESVQLVSSPIGE